MCGKLGGLCWEEIIFNIKNNLIYTNSHVQITTTKILKNLERSMIILIKK